MLTNAKICNTLDMIGIGLSRKPHPQGGNKMEKETKVVLEKKVAWTPCTIVSAKIGDSDYDKEIKNRLAVKVPREFANELIDYGVYSEQKEDFIPTWVKERKDVINLNSKFCVPVSIEIDGTRKTLDFDDALEYPLVGSTAKIKVTYDGKSIYPVALFIKELKDPFEDME